MDYINLWQTKFKVSNITPITETVNMSCLQIKSIVFCKHLLLITSTSPAGKLSATIYYSKTWQHKISVNTYYLTYFLRNRNLSKIDLDVASWESLLKLQLGCHWRYSYMKVSLVLENLFPKKVYSHGCWVEASVPL